MADRDVPILVVDDRPSRRRAPEVASNRLGRLEDDGPDEAGVRQELSTDHDAELVAFEVGEDYVVRVFGLSDVDASRAQADETVDHLCLVLNRLADEVEM
jgi:hypothetical protein